MLKAMVSGDDGRKTLVIGLSKENIRRLKKGYPIAMTDMISSIGIEILIFAGETEQAMARELADMVGATTKVTIDPRLKD